MKKGIFCMIIFLVFCSIGCFSPSAKNTKVCDKFISLMNVSVDEFEREFRGMYMNETGLDFYGDSLMGSYREYYGDWNFFFWEKGDSYEGSLYVFPEEEVFKMDVNGYRDGLRLKNIFLDYGFRFIKTNSDGFDVYKNDSTWLDIKRRHDSVSYYFRLYRN